VSKDSSITSAEDSKGIAEKLFLAIRLEGMVPSSVYIGKEFATLLSVKVNLSSLLKGL